MVLDEASLDTILIVGANMEDLSALSLILEGNGFFIRAAAVGEEALREVRDARPGMILMVPPPSGKEKKPFWRGLVAEMGFHPVPMLAVVDSGDVSAKEKAFESGCADVITRPFSEPEVLARVRIHFLLEHARRARARAEDAQIRNEFRQQELLDRMDVGVLVFEPVNDGEDFVIQDINSAGERISGVRKTDILGRALGAMAPGALRFGQPDILREVCRTGVPARHQVRYEGPGQDMWIENYSYRLPSGEAVAVYRDITVRMKAREGLEWELRVNEAMSELAHDLLSPQRTLQDITQDLLAHAQRLTASQSGYVSARDPAVGAELVYTLSRMAPASSPPEEEQKNSLAIPVLAGGVLVGRIVLANKERDFTQEDMDAAGRLAGLYALGVQREYDLHARKVLDARLAESETKYRQLFENMTSGVAVYEAHEGGEDFIIKDMNQAGARICRIEKGRAIGARVTEMFPGDQDLGLLEVLRDVWQTGEPVVHPASCYQDGNLTSWVEHTVYKLPAGQVVAVFDDLTERVKAEQQKKDLEARLIQQQKLESIGTLAGGVAHEINNPINGIMNYARIIKDRLVPENPLRTFTEEIMHEATRVATIIKNLRAFSRMEKQMHSPADLADIIFSTLSLIRPVLVKDQICVETEVPRNLPKIKCRSQQIQQVLMNLLTNARDALNEKHPGYHEDKILKIVVREFEQDAGKWVRITVEDHGTGVPMEIRNRIFDPFFTTKPKETGTGLGLSMSHGIVRDHKGQLILETETGKFTRVHVDLPADNGWNLAKE